MNYVLVGDGQSPHLLKWVNALLAVKAPALTVCLVSSRGLHPELQAKVDAGLLPSERVLCLGHRTAAQGGARGWLGRVPAVAAALRRWQAQVVHAHYLTSHGSLAWLALAWNRWRGTTGPAPLLLSSAWGSDVLVTPQRRPMARWLLRRVLAASALCSSDSEHMAQRMRPWGARQVQVFPFGLPELPPAPLRKDAHLFFANRGLEPVYRPQRVLELFGRIASQWPTARLAVANTGSLLGALQQQAQAMGLAHRISWLGHLSAEAQTSWYQRAQWYLSLPASDSVSVSVIEAMAHGAVPLLSDLPANRELVDSGHNGLIVNDLDEAVQALGALQQRAAEVAAHNRAWVMAHGLFPPQVQAWVEQVQARLAAP